MPSNSEEAAVLWINKCCKTLENEIRSECSPDEVIEFVFHSVYDNITYFISYSYSIVG